MVAWAAGPFKHFTFIIGAIDHRIFGGNRFDLVFGVSQRGKIAVGNAFHPVTGGANLFVNLKPALEGGAIIRPERPVKMPVNLRKYRRVMMTASRIAASMFRFTRMPCVFHGSG